MVDFRISGIEKHPIRVQIDIAVGAKSTLFLPQPEHKKLRTRRLNVEKPFELISDSLLQTTVLFLVTLDFPAFIKWARQIPRKLQVNGIWRPVFLNDGVDDLSSLGESPEDNRISDLIRL